MFKIRKIVSKLEIRRQFMFQILQIDKADEFRNGHIQKFQFSHESKF